MLLAVDCLKGGKYLFMLFLTKCMGQNLPHDHATAQQNCQAQVLHFQCMIRFFTILKVKVMTILFSYALMSEDQK